MVELLKQPQYQPMDVIDQVVSIFAGSTGLFDDVEVKKVSDMERKMLEYLKAKKSELLEELRRKGKMDEDLKKNLTDAIRQFKAMQG